MAQNDRAFRVKTGIELETLGSNTAPVYSFSGDPNTGIYSSAADNLDVTAGGTQIINATGTVVTFKGTAVVNTIKLTEDSTTGGYLLSLLNNSGLTTDRTLTFNVNNANRTISLSADLTVSNTATVSGTNTGDQNVFTTIAVGTDVGYTWASSNVVSDANSDTLTLVPEVGVNINTDAALDAIKIGVRTGSTSQTGILQLTDSISNTSTTTAATPNSVKTAYDAAVLKSGSVSTGKQSFVAPAVGNASILLPNGAADPSSPVSGDMWVNAGVMKYYNGSATKTIPFSDGTIQVATTITTSSDSSDTTCYPIFVNTASASNQGAKYNSNLAFDALNNVLSVAGGNLLSAGGALGTTAGNSLTPLKVEATSSNADKLHVVIERQNDGSTSTTARWKIKRTVDTTDAGFITLGNTNVITFGKNATTYATFYDGGRLLINTGTDDAVNFLQVAGGISAAIGSNTAPGYTFAGDLNTGIYSSGGDNLSITTGGTQRVSVASTGDVSITSTTASSSTSTGALIVGGGIGVAGTSYIGGVINATNATASSSTSTGALVVTGGVGVGGAAYIGGALRNTSNTGSTSSSTGATVVTGGVGVGENLYVGGIINSTGIVTAAATTTSTSTATGSLVTAGGLGVAENLYVGGVVRHTSSTASSNSTTGALVVTGGVGIGGAINTTGVITTTNATASSSTSTGAVIVTGGVGIGGALYVGSGLDVTGAISASTTITATGDLNVNGGDIITSTTGTFNLVNTNATTLNIGGAATIIGIGASTAVTTFNGTGAIKLPVGTTGERPTAATGLMRWNTTTSGVEIYNGSEWTPAGGSATTIATTAPTSPTPKSGDMWWDNENGELFIYYNDGDTSQWVSLFGSDSEALSSIGDVSLVGTTTISGNIIANGDTITPTELSYLDGVTSDIQTQLDGKLPKAGGTMTGDIDFDNNDLIGLKTACFDAVYIISSPGATPTIDWNNGLRQKTTLSASVTSITFTAPPGPSNLVIVVTPNTYSMAGFPSSVDWGDQGAPTMADGQRFVLMFYYDGTTYFGSYLKGFAE